MELEKPKTSQKMKVSLGIIIIILKIIKFIISIAESPIYSVMFIIDIIINIIILIVITIIITFKENSLFGIRYKLVFLLPILWFFSAVTGFIALIYLTKKDFQDIYIFIMITRCFIMFAEIPLFCITEVR